MIAIGDFSALSRLLIPMTSEIWMMLLRQVELTDGGLALSLFQQALETFRSLFVDRPLLRGVEWSYRLNVMPWPWPLVRKADITA
jgi:hypothetical protein